MKLFTIGYEGAACDDFIATLKRAGVAIVIDVREVAQSRRPGFSKTALSSALANAGMDYLHMRQLGDPKHGREAARAGRMEEFRHIFSAHMDLPASQSAVADVAAITLHKAAALLCFERDPKCCHRSIVAHHVVALTKAAVTHLGVQPSGKKQPVAASTPEPRHA